MIVEMVWGREVARVLNEPAEAAGERAALERCGYALVL